ncbi:hypothetical protein AB0L40_00215 [Patulibacter sp. NPDC049589]|uniref:hypothetical protein n=1 Tax=Patulibacter sp. NPDC049589 TaxID=3154731 RepID=UPI003416844F
MSPDGPVADANASRNTRRERGRRARWAPARAALAALLQDHLVPGARVAVVGAGNGDDLPLGAIAARASSVTLLDIDPDAALRARGRVRRGLRRRVRTLRHDVTGGAADHVVRGAVAAGGDPVGPPAPGGAPGSAAPLPGGPYDLVIGDLLYSQLLYPALLDAGVPADRRRAAIGGHGAALTAAVVARLHASAPVVVHLQDLACWGNGYEQPVDLEDVLEAAETDLPAALALAARTKGPRESDPRRAVEALGIPVLATALWRWPFVEGVDYLVVATVAGEPAGA